MTFDLNVVRGQKHWKISGWSTDINVDSHGDRSSFMMYVCMVAHGHVRKVHERCTLFSGLLLWFCREQRKQKQFARLEGLTFACLHSNERNIVVFQIACFCAKYYYYFDDISVQSAFTLKSMWKCCVLCSWNGSKLDTSQTQQTQYWWCSWSGVMALACYDGTFSVGINALVCVWFTCDKLSSLRCLLCVCNSLLKK